MEPVPRISRYTFLRESFYASVLIENAISVTLLRSETRWRIFFIRNSEKKTDSYNALLKAFLFSRWENEMIKWFVKIFNKSLFNREKENREQKISTLTLFIQKN